MPLPKSPGCSTNDWPRNRATRKRAALRSLVVVATSGLLAACAPADQNDADDRAGETAGSPEELYKAEVDEGLGASVAILLDHSGSMEDKARGDRRAKYLVARDAIATVLASTDSFVAAQPDIPVNVGLFAFSGRVRMVVPIQRYDGQVLRSALEAMGPPDGATAIGDAMAEARKELYRAGTFRKYILVITDGENTNGEAPAEVAQEIAQRSEGAVRMYFIAFDVDARHFAFVQSVRGEVVSAANGDALKTSLNNIYRGKILAEAVNAGETLPDPQATTTKRVP